MRGEGGRGEARGAMFSSNLPFTYISQAIWYTEITTSIFIQLIPHLFCPFYLILLMTKGEQWITVSK